METKQQNEEILEKHQIENSPFNVIGNDKIGYFIAIGDKRVTERMENIETAKNYPTTNMWKLITSLSVVIYENMKNLNEL